MKQVLAYIDVTVLALVFGWAAVWGLLCTFRPEKSRKVLSEELQWIRNRFSGMAFWHPKKLPEQGQPREGYAIAREPSEWGIVVTRMVGMWCFMGGTAILLLSVRALINMVTGKNG